MSPRSAQHRREVLSGYFTAVTEMDRNIGRILDWLDASDVMLELYELCEDDALDDRLDSVLDDDDAPVLDPVLELDRREDMVEDADDAADDVCAVA